MFAIGVGRRLTIAGALGASMVAVALGQSGWQYPCFVQHAGSACGWLGLPGDGCHFVVASSPSCPRVTGDFLFGQTMHTDWSAQCAVYQASWDPFLELCLPIPETDPIVSMVACQSASGGNCDWDPL